MKTIGLRTLIASVTLLLALALLTLVPLTALKAQSNLTTVTGVVTQIETNAAGELLRFTLSDSEGNARLINVSAITEFGLEDRAGNRWTATLAEQPLEAASRLTDHRQRFAPVTVVLENNNVAVSVVEARPTNVETNLVYVLVVFAVTWAVLFAYILWMVIKQRQIQAEVKKLRAKIDIEA